MNKQTTNQTMMQLAPLQQTSNFHRHLDQKSTDNSSVFVTNHTGRATKSYDLDSVGQVNCFILHLLRTFWMFADQWVVLVL